MDVASLGHGHNPPAHAAVSRIIDEKTNCSPGGTWNVKRPSSSVVVAMRADPDRGCGRSLAADLGTREGLVAIAVVDDDAAERAALDHRQVGRRLGRRL